jgi:hypothetical protein
LLFDGQLDVPKEKCGGVEVSIAEWRVALLEAKEGSQIKELDPETPIGNSVLVAPEKV